MLKLKKTGLHLQCLGADAGACRHSHRASSRLPQSEVATPAEGASLFLDFNIPSAIRGHLGTMQLKEKEREWTGCYQLTCGSSLQLYEVT